MSLFSNVNGYGNGGYGFYPLGGGKKTEGQTEVTAKETIDVKKADAPEQTAKTDGMDALTDKWYGAIGVHFSAKVPAWNNPNLTTAQRLELAFAGADPLNNVDLRILDEEIAGMKPNNSEIADMKIAEYEARQNRTAGYIAANWA